MPNYCDFTMKIVGKKESVSEFVDTLKADYDYEANPPICDHKHFWRVFSADVIEEEYLNDIEYSATVCGYCAWSVYSCMFDGEHTYQGSKDKENCNGTDILTESAKHNLEIEIFSSESGVGFQEHYRINNGIVEYEECKNYQEFCKEWFTNPEESYKKLQAEYGDNSVDFSSIEEDDTILFGGLEDFGKFNI